MANRHRFLVTYDIRDPKRLRRVYTTMKEYGQALQYSVFACDLTRSERLALQHDLEQIVDATVDSIMFVDLGNAETQAPPRTSYLGQKQPLPPTGQATVL